MLYAPQSLAQRKAQLFKNTWNKAWATFQPLYQKLVLDGFASNSMLTERSRHAVHPGRKVTLKSCIDGPRMSRALAVKIWHFFFNGQLAHKQRW